MARPELTPYGTAACAAGLLVVGVGGIGPAAAQQAPYRAALVEAEVICRAGPSHSAEAAGLLRVGNSWGIEFLVVRTEADEEGEIWIHIGARNARPYGVDDDCWVPESVVVSTEGAGHLLQLADRLLSASAWPPLEHLLAAHSQFVHAAYRERVDASPALSGRRTMLLAKAVEAAQRTEWFAGRRIDRDPLVLAWIESLGDQVRYSGDRSGRGMWAVVVEPPDLEEDPSESQQAGSATPAEGRELAIIAPDVACRSRPSRSAWSWTILPIDLHLRTERADTSVAGDTWVFVVEQGCWVLAEHTAAGGTNEHVLAIADRFLTSGEAWSFDNHLRVYTVLSSRNRGHREDVEVSAILGLRRLQVLRGALRPLSPLDADALIRAWIGALGGEVKGAHEGHSWTVSDEAYLNLYEKHRPDPFAEEIMWEYASESVRRDCEGMFVCDVEESVINRLARYWIDFPNGRHIADAVERGRAVLGYGLESCNAAHVDPDSYEGRMWRLDRWKRAVDEVARKLRVTLDGVSEDAKAPLIEMLDELERCAGAGGFDATS